MISNGIYKVKSTRMTQDKKKCYVELVDIEEGDKFSVPLADGTPVPESGQKYKCELFLEGDNIVRNYSNGNSVQTVFVPRELKSYHPVANK